MAWLLRNLVKIESVRVRGRVGLFRAEILR